MGFQYTASDPISNTHTIEGVTQSSTTIPPAMRRPRCSPHAPATLAAAHNAAATIARPPGGANDERGTCHTHRTMSSTNSTVIANAATNPARSNRRATTPGVGRAACARSAAVTRRPHSGQLPVVFPRRSYPHDGHASDRVASTRTTSAPS